MKYRKKPVVIDAEQMQTTGEVVDFLHNNVSIPYEAGDWIITGVKGERYACKDEVFRETYEIADAGDVNRLGTNKIYPEQVERMEGEIAAGRFKGPMKRSDHEIFLLYLGHRAGVENLVSESLRELEGFPSRRFRSSNHDARALAEQQEDYRALRNAKWISDGMKRARYIGPREDLRGKLAIMDYAAGDESLVLAQFDHESDRGWNWFRAAEFEEIQRQA